MTPVEELKARAETKWSAPVVEPTPGIVVWHALVLGMGQTFQNIRVDLARCKETMSPEDYTACLEYALNDFIPRLFSHPPQSSSSPGQSEETPLAKRRRQ